MVELKIISSCVLGLFINLDHARLLFLNMFFLVTAFVYKKSVTRSTPLMVISIKLIRRTACVYLSACRWEFEALHLRRRKTRRPIRWWLEVGSNCMWCFHPVKISAACRWAQKAESTPLVWWELQLCVRAPFKKALPLNFISVVSLCWGEKELQKKRVRTRLQFRSRPLSTLLRLSPHLSALAGLFSSLFLRQELLV